MCAQTEEKPDLKHSSEKEEETNAPSYVTIEKYLTAAAYAGFVIYGAFFAPGSFSEPGELQKILSGNLAEANDIFFAIFNLIGAIGINYAAVFNAGAAKQKKLSTNLFSSVGLLLGFLVLGPYMIGRTQVRKVTREEVEARGVFSRILESRIFGATVLMYCIWIYGFTFGLFTPGSEQLHDAMFYAAGVDLSRLFVTDRFVAMTTIDTCLLALLFWGPLTEDMRRRGWFASGQETESWLTALSILSAPGLGAALYLVLRPRLPSAQASDTTNGNVSR